MNKDNSGKLPEKIIRAIYAEELSVINQWIDKETINYTDKDGRSAIFIAVLADSVKMFKLILEDSPNVNLKDKMGWSVLHYIAQYYQVEMAKLIIEYGVHLESEDDYGNTPLWRAVFSSQGRGEMILLLLSNGADKDHKNLAGVSPIELADKISNYGLVQFFS